MEIRKIHQPKSEWEKLQSGSQHIAEAGSVILDINQKKVKVRKAKIQDIARGLAEIAFSMGETNNPEEFAKTMAEDIFEGIKKAAKRRKK